MEKKSYFNVGRKLTDEEYQELRNWRDAPENKNMRFRRYDEIESRPNMYFFEYSKTAKDGERWNYHPGFKKEKVLTQINKFGFSYYLVNRKLTSSEYLTLKTWINYDNNPHRWKTGDIHPLNNLIFFSYGKSFINGECWLPEEKFKSRVEAAKSLYIRKTEPKTKTKEDLGQYYNARFNPKFPTEANSEGKFTLFKVARRLTESEWEELKIWKKENPSLVWSLGDQHPQKPDLVFFGYNPFSYAGETWITSEMLKTYQEKHVVAKRKLTLEDRERKKVLRRFSSNIRSSMYIRFKTIGSTKDKRTEDLLCMLFEDFKDYIESKFEPWMNWDNYGNINRRIPDEFDTTWHLDHIIPTSVAENEWEVELLNHYSNFAPLCSRINSFVKRGKLDFVRGKIAA